MKIWTYGSSPRSGSRNAWTRIKNATVSVVWATFGISSARFKWFPVGRDCWPRTKPGYITMTRRQSNNQWSGGIAAHTASKNSEWKNPLEKFSLRFFGIKTASSSLIIYQRAKLSARSINLYACAIEGHFEGKTQREGHKGVLFLQDNAPAHRPLATRKKLAYLCFHSLDHLPYSSDLAPAVLPTVPWTEKQLNVRHFSSEAEVIAAAETSLDEQNSEFFWVACKSYSNGLRSILSFVGEYVE